MALIGTSPRKIIPLNTGDDTRPHTPAAPSTTTRAFFCGVVVELGAGKELDAGSEVILFLKLCLIQVDVRALVASLGDRMTDAESTSSSELLQDSQPYGKSIEPAVRYDTMPR